MESKWNELQVERQKIHTGEQKVIIFLVIYHLICFQFNFYTLFSSENTDKI